jgi:hypothetical protein
LYDLGVPAPLADVSPLLSGGFILYGPESFIVMSARNVGRHVAYIMGRLATLVASIDGDRKVILDAPRVDTVGDDRKVATGAVSLFDLPFFFESCVFDSLGEDVALEHIH